MGSNELSLLYRIGIDCGGTNTDSSLLKGQEVVATHKVPTSADVLTGVRDSIAHILELTHVPVSSVGSVVLGTTSFLNALLQASDRLSRVCVLRLANPGSSETPPFIDFPPLLKTRLMGPFAVVAGGHNIDGSEIAKFDELQVVALAQQALAAGIKQFAISGCFSTVSNSAESQAAKVIECVAQEMGKSANITLSSDIGQLGLLQRENAAILNASLRPYAASVCTAFASAMTELGFDRRRVFMSQNDGTIMSINEAAVFPVLTIGAGPTNSMRGAAFLSGLSNAVVADLGGTSTDVGVLECGFPRRASTRVKIAGVSTNFSMPDVTSIGLGGGSLVTYSKDGSCEVGPTSLGYKLIQDSLIFGGNTLCASDIAVAAGLAKFGDPSKVQHLSKDCIDKALTAIQNKVVGVVDAVKTSVDEVPLVLVGGGSILVKGKVPGTSECLFPNHFSSANAVGAALPKVSGQADMVFPLKDTPKEEAIAKAIQVAIEAAIQNGAIKETVEVIEMRDTAQTYQAASLRVQVKVVGDLSPDFCPKIKDGHSPSEEAVFAPSNSPAPAGNNTAEVPQDNSGFTNEPFSNESKEWILTEKDVEAIALGTGIAGTGGGGGTYCELLRLKNIIRQGGKIRVVRPEDVPDDAVACTMGIVGSPTILSEKYFGRAPMMALAKLEEAIGKKATHLFALEIGGFNGLQPLVASAKTGLPVIDTDGMGRAFPKVGMFYPVIAGADLCPLIVCSEEGVSRTYKDMSVDEVEAKFSTDIPELGCAAGLALAPLTGRQVKEITIKHTVSMTWRLGMAVLKARDTKQDPIQAIVQAGCGVQLFFGKITQVSWLSTGRFSTREIGIDGLNADQGKQMSVFVQNENIVAKVNGEVVASVPDLICILAEETAEPVFTEDLKYGQRVAVVALPCDPLFCTQQGLAATGPKAFGFDFPYKPILV